MQVGVSGGAGGGEVVGTQRQPVQDSGEASAMAALAQKKGRLQGRRMNQKQSAAADRPGAPCPPSPDGDALAAHGGAVHDLVLGHRLCKHLKGQGLFVGLAQLQPELAGATTRNWHC